MSYYEYMGEYPYMLFKVASRLPDSYNAKTDDTSFTRGLLVDMFMPEVSDLRRDLIREVHQLSAGDGVTSVIDCNSKYEIGVDPTLFSTEVDHANNRIFNSAFDLIGISSPQGWDLTGTLSYGTSPRIGLRTCILGSGSTLSQDVFIDHGGTILRFGCSFNSASNGSITVSWDTGSSTKTLVGYGYWKSFDFSCTIPNTATEVSITLTGPGEFDCVFVSRILHEWSHSYLDNPWFFENYTVAGLVYGVTGDSTQRTFMCEDLHQYMESPPLLGVETVCEQLYSYSTYSIPCGSVNFSSSTEYVSIPNIISDIESAGGTNVVLSWVEHGTEYNSSTSPYAILRPYISYNITSDTPAELYISRMVWKPYFELTMTGHERITYLDSRMSSTEWLSFYDVDCTGTVDVAYGEEMDITLTNTRVTRMCTMVDQSFEPLYSNKDYGTYTNYNGTNFELRWLCTGDCLSIEFREIAGEYYTEGAKLVEFSYYDESANKIYFTDIPSYTIKDFVIDQEGWGYALVDHSGSSYVHIFNANYVKPNQSYIYIWSSIPLETQFTSDQSLEIRRYKYSRKLHIENIDAACDVELIYPYSIADSDNIYTQQYTDTITVVTYDNPDK